MTISGDTGPANISQSSVARIRIHAHGYWINNAQQMGVSEGEAVRLADEAVSEALFVLASEVSIYNRFLYEIPPSTEVIDYIKELGESIIQGAHLGRPAFLEEFLDQLSSSSPAPGGGGPRGGRPYFYAFCTALQEVVHQTALPPPPLIRERLIRLRGTLRFDPILVRAASNARGEMEWVSVSGLVGRPMWREALLRIGTYGVSHYIELMARSLGRWVGGSSRLPYGDAPGDLELQAPPLRQPEETLQRAQSDFDAEGYWIGRGDPPAGSHRRPSQIIEAPEAVGICTETWMGYGRSEGKHFSCTLPHGHSGGHVGAAQTQVSAEAIEDILTGMGGPSGFAAGLASSGSHTLERGERYRRIDIDDDERRERMTPEERADFEAWQEIMRQREAEEEERYRHIDIDDLRADPSSSWPKGWIHTDTIHWYIKPEEGESGSLIELLRPGQETGEDILATSWGSIDVYRVPIRRYTRSSSGDVERIETSYSLYPIDEDGTFRNISGRKVPWRHMLEAGFPDPAHVDVESAPMHVENDELISQYTLDPNRRILYRGKPFREAHGARLLPRGSRLEGSDPGVERFRRLTISDPHRSSLLESELTGLHEQSSRLMRLISIQSRTEGGVEPQFEEKLNQVIAKIEHIRSELEDIYPPDLESPRLITMSDPLDTGWEHTHDIHIDVRTERPGSPWGPSTLGRGAWKEEIPVHLSFLGGEPDTHRVSWKAQRGVRKLYTREEWAKSRDFSSTDTEFLNKLRAVRGLGPKKLESLLRLGSAAEIAHASFRELAGVRPRLPQYIQEAIRRIEPKPEEPPRPTWYVKSASDPFPHQAPILYHKKGLEGHTECYSNREQATEREIFAGDSPEAIEWATRLDRRTLVPIEDASWHRIYEPRPGFVMCQYAVLHDKDWEPPRHIELRRRNSSRRRGRRRRRRRRGY